MSRPATNDTAALLISAEMAKAVSDRWRSRIMMELSVRPLSPSQFVELVGGELTHIARCFRQLAEWGFIELVETKRGGHRRGGVEHVYRSIHRAHFDTSVWERLPRAYRDECSGSTLQSYIARITEAIEAGTLDDEHDRHLSWDQLSLDRFAWRQLVTRLDETLYWLPELAGEAARRMRKTGEEPIPTTVGLAAFPAARESTALAPRRSQELVGAPDIEQFAISAKTAKAIAN